MAASLMAAAVVANQLAVIGPARTWRMLDGTTAVLPALVALFLVLPVADWVIYRRLWRIPVAALAATVRKAAINELILGYGGDAYLYGWARRRAVVRPFAVVRDVAVTSALAGQVATILLLAATLPRLWPVLPAATRWLLLGSASLLVVAPLVVVAWGRRLFALTDRDLAFVAGLHAARIAASLLLSATVWLLLMPGIAAGHVLVLTALRQLVSRLPLVASKDMLFASIAVAIVGHEAPVAGAAALVATAMLALNGLALGGLLLVDACRGIAIRFGRFGASSRNAPRPINA